MNDRDQFHVIQIGDVIDAIEGTPTVDPVKHAHWTNTKRYLDKMACSNCGGMPVINFNWCPYCGAKMDEVI